MARGAAEKASASSAMRLASALQHSKCRDFEPRAQGRHWMARDGYLFSVALATILTAQENAAFTLTQAEQFAAKYSVVLQYDDKSPGGNNTGLSLTVFRNTQTNQLMLAIRGTTASDLDDWKTNGSILTGGAGYDQIAALYNWWQRVSAAPGTMVAQYSVSTSNQGDPNALAIPGGLFLVRKANVAATGELVGAGGLATDPDHRIDVTGHSLGGHLAMAFAALFGASTASGATFNAPGFALGSSNQTAWNGHRLSGESQKLDCAANDARFTLERRA